jgi:hypothetical protein
MYGARATELASGWLEVEADFLGRFLDRYARFYICEVNERHGCLL